MHIRRKAVTIADVTVLVKGTSLSGPRVGPWAMYSVTFSQPVAATNGGLVQAATTFDEELMASVIAARNSRQRVYPVVVPGGGSYYKLQAIWRLTLSTDLPDRPWNAEELCDPRCHEGEDIVSQDEREPE